MPNFSFLGGLEVAQNYFPGGGWAVIIRNKANLSSAELDWTSQLELSLAIVAALSLLAIT